MKRTVVLCVVFLVFPCIALATPVPDTGQTQCYDNTQEITCPNPGEDFYGQDGNYAPCNPHSYTKLDSSGNPLPDDAPWPWAMVKDNLSGLIWEVKTDDGSIHDKDDYYNWFEAQDVFIPALNSLQFGGYNDWSLPTVQQLSTLTDSSVLSPGPSINSDYFPHTIASEYWSSTTNACSPLTGAWMVGFRDGRVNCYAHSEWVRFKVMAVRGGQTSNNNFHDNGDGTITDFNTGLIWQQENAPDTYTWQEALAYCENLTLAGYDDWRLPNRNEFQSIVDYTKCRPSIDSIFSNTASSDYWSSTTGGSGNPYGWLITFTNGPVDNGIKSLSRYVRAVRAGLCGDSDGDMIPDEDDNCPNNYNPGQEDIDGDTAGDVCDNCPVISNSNQEDTDDDNVGNICDNCPDDSNADQEDLDCDGLGDACDTCFNDYYNDIDMDNVCGNVDNCPNNANPNQEDSDSDGMGDVCDICTDLDNDGYGNPGFSNNTCTSDNCPMNFNSNQEDADSDGMGDVCDNCSEISNPDQLDIYPPQGNGIGNACECEGDFNCDGDVDGSDASLFKFHFGRSLMNYPCNDLDTCRGDFNCDGDVDGTDASLFKQDFGRSSIQNPCPACFAGVDWCQYQ